MNMCNAPFTTDFQKAAFRPAKAYLLEAERLPFTSRKATFWKTAAALTYELMATLTETLPPIPVPTTAIRLYSPHPTGEMKPAAQR